MRLNQIYSDREIINAVLIFSALSVAVGLSVFAPDILVTICAVGAVSYVLWLKHSWVKIEQERERAAIAKKQREARFSVASCRQGVVTYTDDAGVQFWTRERNHKGGRIEQGAADREAGAGMPLNRALLKYDRVLLIGGMGTGKSELLKHLAHERSQQGETMIIDSHAAPDTWPGGRVVGMGRNYPEIEREIGRVVGIMDRRYQYYSSGQKSDFPQLTVIIDEMTVTNQFCDVSEPIKAILCECRKVNIKLIVAGQSDRAGALGLRGNYDLISGFEAICYLEKDPATGDYYGLVKTPGNGPDQRFFHPGIFMSRHSGASWTPPPEPEKPGFPFGRDGVTELTYDPDQEAWAQYKEPETQGIFESHESKIICDMFVSGASLNAIARELWGSSNGRRTAYIKAVLGDHGLM